MHESLRDIVVIIVVLVVHHPPHYLFIVVVEIVVMVSIVVTLAKPNDNSEKNKRNAQKHMHRAHQYYSYRCTYYRSDYFLTFCSHNGKNLKMLF